MGSYSQKQKPVVEEMAGLQVGYGEPSSGQKPVH